ncbi:MAG: hypothetical protein ACRDRO_21705 [Pseudonocardiaceae bacterium]
MTCPDNDDTEAAGFGLVMPFVSVVSKGGPHADDAYVAGYEMGQLAGRLEYGRPAEHEQRIRAENTEQADLIAMQHGYRAEIYGAQTFGWRVVALTRTVELRQG